MTQQDLNTIEEHLGMSLPNSYVTAALSGVFSEPIHNDAQSIIGINMALRSGEFGDASWNPNLLAFGHDGGGNYYCIDVQDLGAGVFLRDHETLEVHRVYESFTLFQLEWT